MGYPSFDCTNDGKHDWVQGGGDLCVHVVSLPLNFTLHINQWLTGHEGMVLGGLLPLGLNNNPFVDSGLCVVQQGALFVL